MERKKKRSVKARLKKAARGSISVLLCLLITPFLSITLGLIEYGRYQQLVEISNEFMDLLGISQIADYDTYIHNRFGLLAVSQENELGDGLGEIMEENAKSMGQQITVLNTNVTGVAGMTFMDVDILTKQLVDVSELTATTAVITKDAKLEELLNKLNEAQSFTGVMDTVSDLADATDAVNDTVKAVKKLKEDMSGLQQKVNNVKTKGEELAGKVSALYEKLGKEGITLPENATLEEIEAAVTTFKDTYLDDIKELYTLAKGFKDSIDAAKNAFTGINTDMQTLKGALSKAKNAIDKIGTKNELDKDGSISDATVRSLDEILDDMDKLVNDTLKDIKDTTISTAKDALDEIFDYVNESTGLVDVVEKYGRIASGQYFKVDPETHRLSEEVENDIVSLLKAAKKIYDNASSGADDGEDVAEIIKETIVGNFVPDMSQLNFSELTGKIDSVISEATKKLGEKVENKMTNMFSNLGNLAKEIFNLDVTYNPMLNAEVTVGNPERNNPNQEFVNAVTRLVDAVNQFSKPIEGLGDILKMLGSLKDMLIAIKDMIGAVMGKIGKFIESIHELVDNGATTLYERFIISGYMRHNLPSRVCAGKGDTNKVELGGVGLTGFRYNDIARGNGTFKGAELEYVYSGTNSEEWNQKLLFWDMYFLRLVLNLPTVFLRSNTVNALAASATVASWAVYLLYILIEPFLDTLLLVNGGKVALLKDECWMTPTGVLEFGNKLASAATECQKVKDSINKIAEDISGGAGGAISTDSAWELGYETYTLILLAMMVGTSSQVQRLSNIIDMETKQYYSDKGMSGRFSLGSTYVAVKVESSMSYKQFFDLGGVPEVTLDRVVAY